MVKGVVEVISEPKLTLTTPMSPKPSQTLKSSENPPQNQLKIHKNPTIIIQPSNIILMTSNPFKLIH